MNEANRAAHESIDNTMAKGADTPLSNSPHADEGQGDADDETGMGRHGEIETRPDLVWDKEAPGLYVRVYGDGSKSFILVYRVDDRQRFVRIGKSSDVVA